MSSELKRWLGGIALLASAACGSAQTNTSKVELHAEVGALPPRMEPYYHLFAVNCSKCHGLERALSAPVTDHGHWERYVAKMMRTPGSGISAQEGPGILAFLFWYTDQRTGKTAEPGAPAPEVSAPEVSAPEVSAPEIPQEAPAPAAEPSQITAPQGEGAP